jgi:hypothetical protein
MKKIEKNLASKRAAKLIVDVKSEELGTVTGGFGVPAPCRSCGMVQQAQ